MIKKNSTFSSASAFVQACKNILAVTAAATSAPLFAQQLQLEEVVVTAERREQSLQQAPLAVSAFDETAIKRRQALNTVDIVNNVPNLVGNNNIGQSSATTVFLRGVGTTESIVTVDAAMGFYIDDIYIARQGVNNFSLYDLERVEVLRGPQGTLYGRNSSAGAIKLITKRPSDRAGFSVEGSFGEFDRWALKGSANGPLGDRLAVRLNVLSEGGDGYSKNRTLNRDVNDRDNWGIRFSALFEASEDVDILLSADRSRSDSAGVYASDIGGIVRPPSGDVFTVVSGTDSRNEAETDGVHLTLDWNINEQFSLQSLSAARNTYQRWNLDLTDQPVSIFNVYTLSDSDQLTQEFKLTGDFADGAVSLVSGVFYFEEDSYSFIGDEINLAFADGTRAPLPFFGRFYQVDTESWAVFAEVRWQLREALALTLGGRYTEDDKQLDIRQSIGGSIGFEPGDGAPGFDSDTLRQLGTPTDLDFSEFTPKIGLRYDFNDDISSYITFTNGFKSGGWSARTNEAAEVVTFDPETVNSYEIGLKSTLLNGRGRVNIAAFYYDYQDLFNTGTGEAGNFIVATNDARVHGIELESTVRLSDTLDVFGFVGVQDGKYLGVDPALDGTVVGSELQRLPQLSYKLGFSKTFGLPYGSLQLTADYSFQDDHFTNLQNTPSASSGDIELLNAALSWRSPGERWSTTLSCRNCNDETYLTQSLDFAGLGFVAVYPGEPRTWLVTVGFALE